MPLSRNAGLQPAKIFWKGQNVCNLLLNPTTKKTIFGAFTMFLKISVGNFLVAPVLFVR